MRPELERWAEALAIERQHGQTASAYLEGRIAELALHGDATGVTRLRQIAEKLELLDPANVAITS